MLPYYQKWDHYLYMDTFHNMDFPAHLHKHVEMLFVQEGMIDVQIMEETQTLSAGDCALIFPEQIHSYQSDLENAGWILIFDTAITGNFLHTFQKYCPVSPFISTGAFEADIILAFQKLYEYTRPQHSLYGTPYLESSCIQVILALLLPHAELEKRKTTETMNLTFRMVQYIAEHFREPLTLDILAQELYVNKYYISHIFSERFHMNFRCYLNQLRLEYALQLIRTTEQPLTAIWAEAGFNSQRSFNRAFLEKTGETPSDYRRTLKKNEKNGGYRHVPDTI